MQTGIDHIQITGMVHVHHLRLMPINTLFKTLDEIETIVRKAKELNPYGPNDRFGGLCRFCQGGELITDLKAIALRLP